MLSHLNIHLISTRVRKQSYSEFDVRLSEKAGDINEVPSNGEGYYRTSLRCFYTWVFWSCWLQRPRCCSRSKSNAGGQPRRYLRDWSNMRRFKVGRVLFGTRLLRKL